MLIRAGRKIVRGVVSLPSACLSTALALLILGSAVAATTAPSNPQLLLSATTLAFANQAPNTTSPRQNVTLTNGGPAALTIAAIALTGGQADDFRVASTCGASLAKGANCTLVVTFKPVSAGAKTADISISSNSSGSPQTVVLAGTGVAMAGVPVLTASATALKFAAQPATTVSPAQTVTLTNSGTSVLTFNALRLSGAQADDFALTSTCNTTLAAKATCTLSVIFKPVSAGNKTAAVSIINNGTNSPQSIPLSGAGTTTPAVNLSAAALTFATQTIGTTSPAQNITLTNSGSSELTLYSFQMTGSQADDYQLSSTCGVSLAAGANCTLAVNFRPVSYGTKTAHIIIADNAGGSLQSVAVSGFGGSQGLTYTLSQTSIAASSSTTSTTYPTATIYYTIHHWSNRPATGFTFPSLTSSGVGISYASFDAVSEAGPPAASDDLVGAITVHFFSPNSLGSGTFNSSFTLSICYNPSTNQGCPQLIAGPPTTVPVTFTVTGAPRPTTSASFYQGPVNLEATQTAASGPSRDLVVFLSGSNGPPLYATFTQPPNGFVSNVSYAALGPNSGTLSIAYKEPRALSLGHHTESLTVNLCVDPKCQYPIANSPFPVTLTYEVTAVAGVSYNATTVPVEANDVAWSASRGKLYAIVSQYSPQLPQSLVEIDPPSGVIVRSVALNGDPTTMAISDDGAYVYIGSFYKTLVQRISLDSLAVDIGIDLGTSEQTGDIIPGFLLAVPNHPHSVVISTFRTTPNITGLPIKTIYVYDDAQVRSNTFAAMTVSQQAQPIAFATDLTTLYAAENFTEALYTAKLSATGLIESAVVPTLNNYIEPPFSVANGLIYDDGGRITDPSSGRRLATFLDEEQIVYGASYDATANRAYLFFADTRVDSNGEFSLGSFDLDTFAPGAVLREPQEFIGQLESVRSGRIIRWGADGLAVIGPHSVQILSGAFVTQ